MALTGKSILRNWRKARDWSLTSLIDELEAIVDAYTKINIDYFLNEIMDEDRLLDLIDFFKEGQEDDIEAVFQELGDEYTEEEIRLVRVKFLSEMGN